MAKRDTGTGRRLRALPVAILVGMLALTATVAVVVWHDQAAQEQQGRQVWARRATRAIDDHVAQTGLALTSVRGLFAASKVVENAEFVGFAAIQLRRSDLLGLTWLPRVPASARRSFERSSGLRIVERASDGSFRFLPATDHAEYFPLRFIAPVTPENTAVLGLDAGSDAGAAALASARDSGMVTMSPAIQLGADPADRGAVLYSAVYLKGAPVGSIAERRAALLGFTSGAFRYAALTSAVATLLPAGTGLQITDAGEPVVVSKGAAEASAVESVELAGRTWTVRVSSPPDGARWVVLATIVGGGLVLTFMAGLLLAQVEKRRREQEASHEELRHEADTDGLTGLGNRRKLRGDFEGIAAGATPDEPVGFVMFDLNGFKHYNDSFGHPAGDDLLARLGRRLAEAIPAGEAYRLGGDEFCALARLGAGGIEPLVAAALDALHEEGEGFAISSAHGAVLMPWDAADAEEAMVLADQRMYQEKALGRASAGRQSADVLMRVLVERSPELGEHLEGVGGLTEAVGRRLGLDQVTLEQVVRAAGLHDVGKVAIPESILTKPAPLDEQEMTFVRRHTVIGERILLAAPSLAAEATLVRASHERWDGTGYPDGLAGEQIPLGSRIIFACDAFEAMTSTERPYRRPVSHELAMEELRRCTGTQFDPEVVAALGQVVRANAAGRSAIDGEQRPRRRT